MRPMTESEIRASFVNTSVRERKAIPMPDAFDTIRWDRLDYLGWRDPKSPAIGYLVLNPAPDAGDDPGAGGGAEPTGIMLRAGAVPARTRPQCALCEDISLPSEVILFAARRAGAAGRKGDTVGTLICANFECSENVRRKPSSVMAGDDPERVRQLRIGALRERVARFVARVGSR
ncbi:FBP domain-containing protein [Gordonia oryzae]|uniref:FBP domain-containing protein n=1 Tax=Gordonia oryzae TaxID=2487349 RepID=A0A3N4GFP3_9ACTN|nr:FBP domain-containing protein [Gordonia oryzae]RPA57881.1 FBP domain-containing protein [Gordonia oryzae]